MGMYDGTVPYDHPRLKDVDRKKVQAAVRHAPKLLEHPDLSPHIIEAIQDGLKCCRDYLRHPIGVSDSTYTRMRVFLDDYAGRRAFWCHGEFQALATSAVPAVYELAKIESSSSSVPSDIRAVVERFAEYGDFFEPVTDILRCDLCFGHKFHNQIDPRTGNQFQWEDIAEMLELDAELSLSRACQRETTRTDTEEDDAYLAQEMVTSIRESAKAMAATEGSVEWQIKKYAVYEESPTGPKKSLRTADWAALANHTHTVRLMLDAFWRSPLPLDCVQRNAARNMIFIVSLTQKNWFVRISEDHDDTDIVNFVVSTDALEPSHRLSETGDSRRESDRRSVPL